jgi:hypothetical protein
MGQWQVTMYECCASRYTYYTLRLPLHHDLAAFAGRSVTAALSHGPTQGVSLTLTLADTAADPAAVVGR